jgi:hypothetical protein|nr:MAG TPA: Major tail protein [Caudoviricetes sp.]
MDNFIPMPPQTDVAAVSPQTTVILASGIEWGNDYEHVRYYENGKVGCLAHVRKKAIHTFQQSAPVRWGDLTYKGKGNESDFLKCNYIAFQNKPYTEEWYFGFVTRVEWLCDGSFKIYFEPDRFQNSFYDVVLQPCYVEREHVDKKADLVGINLVPENLETGDYVDNASDARLLNLGAMQYCLNASADENGTNIIPFSNQGILSGLTIVRKSNYRDLITSIQNYVNSGNGDAIVNVYQAPEACFQIDKSVYVEETIKPSTFDGYSPKNNKLYQYPYCYCLVNDGSGIQHTYNFEYGKNGELTFQVYGVMLNIPAIFVVPREYKNYGGLTSPFGFVINNFPQCSWTNDSYQAFLAQSAPLWDYSKKQNAISQIGNLTGGLVSALGGNLGAGAESIFNATTSTYLLNENINAQKESHDLIPPTAKGTSSGSYVAAALFGSQVYCHVMSVTAQMAKTIDDYFTMYGYATHKIKVPNITGRSKWNFVKTVNCGLHGACVTDDINFLQAMLNRGVTFWHTDDVGNYGLSND